MIRLRWGLALLTASGVSLAACVSKEPSRSRTVPSVDFQLSATTHLALEQHPDVLAELESVLGEYFGTRYEPRYVVLTKWHRLGFDPNQSPFHSAPFAADLEGRRPEKLRQDNRRAFASQLQKIEQGRATEVELFARRPFLTRRWQDFLRRSQDLPAEELQTAATHFLTDYYPGLQEGAWLFVQSCARCHGSDGAGDGPMSDRLTPKPRNYRTGVFKFSAVEAPSKPRRVDLLRTLISGLPGSAMPSFRNRPLAELGGLVDQVRLLSIRGEVERRLLFEWTDDERRPREAVAEVYEGVWERWIEAAEREIDLDPPAPDASRARWERGRQLFQEPDAAGGAGCVRCHGKEGFGNGVDAFSAQNDEEHTALLRDEWGQPITPRDLTRGVFRGGERREDIYLRIHCGIPGTPMPAIGRTVAAVGNASATPLSEDDKWCLVDYVLLLSGRGPFSEGADLSREE